MTSIDDRSHGHLEANGISIHYVEVGEGPLVVFCHGWPESWYSWRHQLPAVAEAGFRAVALSMRGYGETDAPHEIGAYTINHLVGDVVGAVNVLAPGEQAVIVGHDWGAPVAWFSALMRPDLFRAVAGLSVPFIPPIGALPDGVTTTMAMEANAGPDRNYYRLFFAEPGIAEADFEADVDRSVRGVLYTLSGDAITDGYLSEDDVSFYVDQHTRVGFRGGFNWYRNIDVLPAITGPFVGSTIEQPSFYMAGSTDMIAGNTPDNLALVASLPGLRHFEILDGVGHWIQQERPAEVNHALVTFLRGLD